MRSSYYLLRRLIARPGLIATAPVGMSRLLAACQTVTLLNRDVVSYGFNLVMGMIQSILAGTYNNGGIGL